MMKRTRQIATVVTAVAILLGGQKPLTAQQPGSVLSGQGVAGREPALAAPSTSPQPPLAGQPVPGPPSAAATPSMPPTAPAYVPSSPTPGGPAPPWSPVPLPAPQTTFGYGHGASTAYGGLQPMLPAHQAAAQPTTPGVTYINPFASVQGTVGQTVPTIQSALPSAPAMLSEKPFSSYRAPPPISPYMNLFRSGNDFATINNYYTLVRPLLEQQIYNQNTQDQINSLQQATQLQMQSLNQLHQRTDRLYGSPPSGSFMQFQNYYPSYQPSVK